MSADQRILALLKRARDGYNDGLIPVWLPEMTQAEVMAVCRQIAEAEVTQTESSDIRAHKLLMQEFLNLQFDLEAVIGEGFREPAVFFEAMGLLSVVERKQWWADVGSRGIRFIALPELLTSISED